MALSLFGTRNSSINHAHFLDSFFENVCELDLVFNFYKVRIFHPPLRLSRSIDWNGFKVYAILDEVFLAGEIEETSKEVVLARLEQLEKLE